MRRQSAYDTAPPEHSLALSAFRRQTTGAASPSDNAGTSAQQQHARHAWSESASVVRRLQTGNEAGAQPPPGGEPLTLDEVSAAVAAAKLTISAPSAVRVRGLGAAHL